MKKKEVDSKAKKIAAAEKREDKIFNNRYNQGEGLKDPNDYEYNRNIQVEANYSKSYLNDLYDYENNVEYKIFLDENQSLKRALNIDAIPHTIVTKGNKIIYRKLRL